jgi:hypothetical protein
MILAEISTLSAPLSLHVGGWLAALFFLIGGWNQVEKFFDRRKEIPPPAATYQLKGDYAIRQELVELRHELGSQLHSLDAELSGLRAELKKDKDDLLAVGEHRIEKLHGRINDVLEAVAELRGKLSKE